MSPSIPKGIDTATADPRWKDLYRLGGITSFLLAASILFAIVAFFIWPYKMGGATAAEIFATLQNNRLSGLMSLELQILVIQPFSVLQLLALYVTFKRVNESYALIALVLGLIGIGLIFTARPVVELVALSDKYAAATSNVAKDQYLMAGEAYLTLYEGTAWMMWNIFVSISSLVSSWLMLRSKIFSKVTAYTGIVLSIAGLCFLLPVIGIIMAFLGTFGGVIWQVMLGRDFFQVERQSQKSPA